MRTKRRLTTATLVLLLVPVPALAAGPGGAPAHGGGTRPAAAPTASATAAPAAPTGAVPDLAPDLEAGARQLLAEGFTALSKGEKDKALEMFRGAWKVQQHWQIAASLGELEATLGKWPEAATHLSQAQRGVAPSFREKLAKELAEAISKVGIYTVRVDPPDAEILIDGKVTAVKPGEPIYLEADAHHLVKARKGEDSVQVDVVAAPGQGHEVTLKVTPPPTPRSWAVLGTGIGLTAVAAGLGGGFTLIAKDAQTQVESAVAGPCPKNPTSGACKDLADAAHRHDTFRGAAIGTFIGAGVLGAATLTYAIWPEILPVKPAVAAGPDGAFLSVSGRF